MLGALVPGAASVASPVSAITVGSNLISPTVFRGGNTGTTTSPYQYTQRRQRQPVFRRNECQRLVQQFTTVGDGTRRPATSSWVTDRCWAAPATSNSFDLTAGDMLAVSVWFTSLGCIQVLGDGPAGKPLYLGPHWQLGARLCHLPSTMCSTNLGLERPTTTPQVMRGPSSPSSTGWRRQPTGHARHFDQGGCATFGRTSSIRFRLVGQ